jgi:lipopolysaccharide cholinephosphotransferase
MKSHLKGNSALDFPVSRDYPKEKIREVQFLLLDMAKAVCGILEKHEIPYFITFGTLLGAVRHAGFIPWDDDFDIFLFDDSYDEAMLHLDNELPEHLIVHSLRTDPLYFPAWNSVKNLNTQVVDGGLYNSDNNLLKFNCIGVDMYRIKKMGSHQVKSYKIKEAISFFERKSEFGIISQDEFIKQFNQLKKELELALLAEAVAEDKSDVFMFMLLLKHGILPKYIFPLKKYKFENVEFYGPNNHHELLTSAYGKYMEIVKFGKRNPHFLKVSILRDSNT